MPTHRKSANLVQNVRFQSLILNDHAGLPGASAVVKRLGPPLLSFIKRRMGRLCPLEYRFTPEAIARATWREVFPKVGPAFWHADNETDARHALYIDLTGIAAKTLDGYRDRIFNQFYKDFRPYVRRIISNLGVLPSDRDAAENECWLRIWKELPLSDILTRSEIKKFIRPKAQNATIDFMRKNGRQQPRSQGRSVQVTSDPENCADPDYRRAQDGIEARDQVEVIVQACNFSDLEVAIIECHASGMTREEIAEKTGVSQLRVKKALERIRKKATIRYPEQAYRKRKTGKKGGAQNDCSSSH